MHFFFNFFSLATWTCALVHLCAFSRVEASSLSLDLIVLCEHISCRWVDARVLDLGWHKHILSYISSYTQSNTKKTKNPKAELERATAQVYTNWYCRVCVRHIHVPTRTHTHIHAHTYSYARKSITIRVASRRRQTDRNPGENERNGW